MTSKSNHEWHFDIHASSSYLVKNVSVLHLICQSVTNVKKLYLHALYQCTLAYIILLHSCKVNTLKCVNSALLLILALTLNKLFFFGLLKKLPDERVVPMIVTNVRL